MYKVYCHSFDYSKIVTSKAEAMEREWASVRSQNLNKKFKKNQLTFAAKCGIINTESEVDNID